MKRKILGLALFTASVVALYSALARIAPGLLLELGSTTCPRRGFLQFLAVWTVFGTLASWGVVMASDRASMLDVASNAKPRAVRVGERGVTWMLALVAGALAIGVQRFILVGGSVVDDETAYRFASALLESGRLWVPSPPSKLFFDHFLFINDGRFHPFYFLGWPAVRALFGLVGLERLANPILFALSVPAVAASGRILLGRDWGRIGSLLFATSPFLIVLAATDLSHTSVIFCLAWALRAYLKCRRRVGARWWWHAALATSVALAFAARPLSAVGVGGPLLVGWLHNRLREGWRAVPSFVAFLLPAATAAALFLAGQNELYGSPWKNGYVRKNEYHLENGARFVPVSASVLRRVTPELDFADLGGALRTTGCGLLRLGADTLGWPIGLLGIAAAVAAPGAGPAWAMFLGGLASVLFQRSPGVDTFGPVHYAELALPFVLLCAGAGRSIERRLIRYWGAGRARQRVRAGVGSLVLVAWLGYVPVRWASLHGAAASAAEPHRLVAAAAIEPAVVFAPFPWVPPPCMSQPNRYFRWLRPVSGPNFDDSVLWANHLDADQDRELLSHFPGRRGYVLFWTPECDLRLVALDSAEASAIPDGLQRLGR